MAYTIVAAAHAGTASDSQCRQGYLQLRLPCLESVQRLAGVDQCGLSGTYLLVHIVHMKCNQGLTEFVCHTVQPLVADLQPKKI